MSPEATQLIGVGAIAGLVASLVMNWPMSRAEHGFTPAYIAAGVVTRTPPREVSFTAAVVAHHLAGLLVGVGYGVFVAGLHAILPETIAVGQLDVFTHAIAVAVIVAFIYVFFAHVVLPTAAERIYEEESTAVRGQWLRSALVYGGVLLVLVPAIGLNL